MHRLLIDTDTGNDDVWAIICALRATDLVKVEAITVVMGNVCLDYCVKNALIAVEQAGTYKPPVYRGMGRAILRDRPESAVYVHGKDGLSDMNLPWPETKEEKKHAIDAIIDTVMGNPGEIEIVTLGPLTNLAMAYLKEPRIAENVKKVYIMGGAGLDQGNMSPSTEFNIGVDVEAADIVLRSGMDMMWVTWDVCRGEAPLTGEDFKLLESYDTPLSRFAVRCTQSVREWDRNKYGKDTVGIIDSIIMLAVIYPEIQKNTYRAKCAIETGGTIAYGHFSIDKYKLTPDIGNEVEICQEVHADLYKKHLFELLSGK